MTVTVDIAAMARNRLLSAAVRLAAARHIGDDTTEVKSAEEELRRLRQELAQYDSRIAPGVIGLEPRA